MGYLYNFDANILTILQLLPIIHYLTFRQAKMPQKGWCQHGGFYMRGGGGPPGPPGPPRLMSSIVAPPLKMLKR